MSDILSDLDKLIDQIEMVRKLDGQKISADQTFRQAGKSYQPPISERLRNTAEEANNYKRMEDAKFGLATKEAPLTKAQEEEINNGIVEEYIRDQILKVFNG